MPEKTPEEFRAHEETHGLGAAWGEQTAKAMLAEAGFTDVRSERVEGDVFNVYYIATNA